MKKTQILLLVLSLSLMAQGLMMGQLQEIWQKASIICLECIGLG